MSPRVKPECCSSPSSRVTLQPSSKTSYVVLGDNAGPSKLAAIKKHALKTLSEDDFLALIGTRVGPGGPGGAPLDDKTRKKMDKEADAIKAAARELEKREKAARGCGASGGCVWVSACARGADAGVHGQRGRETGRGRAAVDDAVCTADTQGDLREQGSGGEAAAVATRLVRRGRFFRVSR